MCFLFCFLFPFLSLLLIEKKTVPLETCIFGLFLSVSFCLSLAFIWPPLFNFSFLSLSLSISLSLLFSFFFFSFLLFSSLCFHYSFLFFVLFCFLVLVFSFRFLYFCFCFMKKTTSKYSITKFFFMNYLGVACRVFSLKSLVIFVFVLILSCVFVQHQCIWFQKTQVQKHQFLVKRGVATKRFLMNLCFAKCEKLSFFGGHFLANFGCTNTIKIGTSAHFKKQQTKHDHFLWLLIGPRIAQIDCQHDN